MPEIDGAGEAYLRFREVFGGVPLQFRKRYRLARGPVDEVGDHDGEQLPFGPGREPVTVMAAWEQLTRRFDWDEPLHQAEAVDGFAGIVGEGVAAHTTALYIDEGTLLVQCDSTAWATQLRMMRSRILTELGDRYPRAGIEAVRFLNPAGPRWQHGRRSTPGRGPRDTYG